MKEIKSHKRRGKLPKIEVVDLFCGIGGLSFGMKSKGFSILAGFDLDATCKYAYETNNEAKFNYKDIKEVHGIDKQILFKEIHQGVGWLCTMSAVFFLCIQKQRERSE